MSDLRTLAVALILLGVLGVASMLMYLFAYKYVTQQLIPVSHRRRVLAWRRCAPTVLGVSVGTTAIGLLLLVVTAVALAL
ncbi:MAG TPA: hypothetical protein VHZ97_24470 [Pseudonocardiaceae bacterium]|jgi:hypothetical protein|nr:hypothetical protein [Pseudonocardiaceae bacterium]